MAFAIQTWTPSFTKGQRDLQTGLLTGMVNILALYNVQPAIMGSLVTATVALLRLVYVEHSDIDAAANFIVLYMIYIYAYII